MIQGATINIVMVHNALFALIQKENAYEAKQLRLLWGHAEFVDVIDRIIHQRINFSPEFIQQLIELRADHLATFPSLSGSNS